MSAVWIRFPELPIEYYDVGILQRIGGAIGPVLKIDAHTSATSRGRFARVCVQIDLCKPLVNSVKIGSDVQQIMYEGIDSMCFKCGLIGHEANYCKMNKGNIETEEEGVRMEKGSSEDGGIQRSPARTEAKVSEERKEGLGPWMLVRGRKQSARQRPGGRGNLKEDQTRGRPAVIRLQGNVQEMTGNGNFPFEFGDQSRDNAPTSNSGAKEAFQFVVKGPSNAKLPPKHKGLAVKPNPPTGPKQVVANSTNTHDPSQILSPPNFHNPNPKRIPRRSHGKKKTQPVKDHTADACILESWFGGACSELKVGEEELFPRVPSAIGEDPSLEPYPSLQEGGHSPTAGSDRGASPLEGKIIIDLSQCGDFGGRNTTHSGESRGGRQEELSKQRNSSGESPILLDEQVRGSKVGKNQVRGTYEDPPPPKTNVLDAGALATDHRIQPEELVPTKDQHHRSNGKNHVEDGGADHQGDRGESLPCASMEWSVSREIARLNRE